MKALMADWRPEERAAAQKAVSFFETQLRHFEGKHAGKPFLLELWQESIIRRMFGRLRSDGTRLYRTAYIELGRKNGKSSLCAGIALYLLVEDGERGAQVFSAAGDRAQARIVFRQAMLMAQRSPAILAKVLVFQNIIETREHQSFYKVLSADADSQHGLNVHGAVMDELHTQPNRDLWDVLTTGTGAREQPLVVAITTAGFDRHSICWELHEYARKIIDGTIADESFLAVIYGADVGDDWTSPATWRKANPNLGVSVRMDYIRGECEKAKRSPAYEGTFRRLHLSQWTSQETRFIPMARWDECSARVDEIELRGQVCFAGLDLSSSVDLTAFVLVFPRDDGTYHIVPRFFMPIADIADRSKREGVPYEQWATRDGYITATEGEIIDYAQVREQIERDKKTFDIREIAFDRWGAGQLSQDLDAMGFTVVPFGQGYGSMSNPTKELLSLVIGRKIVHGGNPVLRWMADCVSVLQDPAGNIKPVKPDRRKNSSRIDGIVAAVMGLDRAMRHRSSLIGGPKGQSVYDERELFVL